MWMTPKLKKKWGGSFSEVNMLGGGGLIWSPGRGGKERGFSSGKNNLLHVPTTLFIVTFQVGAWARSRLLGTLIYCQCMYRKSMVQSIWSILPYSTYIQYIRTGGGEENKGLSHPHNQVISDYISCTIYIFEKKIILLLSSIHFIRFTPSPKY